MNRIVLVALGGGLGSVLRYGMSGGVPLGLGAVWLGRAIAFWIWSETHA